MRVFDDGYISAGGFVRDVDKPSLTYPLDTETNCNWIGCANSRLREEVMVELLSVLKEV